MPNTLITSNPSVMFGKPCVTGTRITVEIILDRLAAGESEEELLRNFPRLTIEGVRAALAYASKSLSLEELVAEEEHSS